MGELEELRIRADRAISKLSSVQDARNRQSQDLMDRLTDVKAKYQTRNEELENWQQQIEALSCENTELEALANRLVQAVNEVLSSDDENAASGMPDLTSDFVADLLELEDGAVSWPDMSHGHESDDS